MSKKSYPWLTSASEKGVEARRKKREEEYQSLKMNINNKMKLKDTFYLLSKLSGFIMGDGYLEIREEKNWRHYEIRFYPDDLFLANLFCDTFYRLYEKKPSITSLGNYYCVRVTSKFACEHLTKFASYKTLKWRAPKKFLIDRTAKIEFVRALFDCEGYVGAKNIQFQSVNKKGINDLAQILLELGVISKIYSYKRSNPNWNINYILIIPRKENIKRYLEIIGFNHSSKKNKLNLLAGVPER